MVYGSESRRHRGHMDSAGRARAHAGQRRPPRTGRGVGHGRGTRLSAVHFCRRAPDRQLRACVSSNPGGINRAMTTAVIGISFRTAPIELREQAAFRSDDVSAALQRIRAAFPGAELVLVSTCNRRKLYTTGIDVDEKKGKLVGSLQKDPAVIPLADAES